MRFHEPHNIGIDWRKPKGLHNYEEKVCHDCNRILERSIEISSQEISFVIFNIVFFNQPTVIICETFRPPPSACRHSSSGGAMLWPPASAKALAATVDRRYGGGRRARWKVLVYGIVNLVWLRIYDFDWKYNIVIVAKYNNFSRNWLTERTHICE